MKRLVNYTDYRVLLNDLIEYKKKSDYSFSINKFSKKIGVSRSLIKMIISGDRNLSIEVLLEIAAAFNFSYEEKVFFESLVHENQASTEKERYYHRKKRKEAKKSVIVSCCHIKSGFAFDQWYYPALLLYLIDIEKVAEEGLNKIDYKKIQKIFSIDKVKLNIIIESFKKLGLLDICNDGKVKLCLDNVGQALKRQNFILKIIEESSQRARKDFLKKDNFFSADTISISSTHMQSYIQDYQRLVSKYIGKDLLVDDKTKIVQLSLQMFSVN